MARLEVTPSSGPAPLQITANGSTSKAGKGAKITSYDFDFGDAYKTGPQPKVTVKHSYESPGTYTVTLTVTNSAGRTDQTTQDVKVTRPPPSDPTAKLRVTPRSGPAPLQITASGSTSKAGQGATITSYDFNFGDGNKTGPQPKATLKHTYKSPGTYTVTLTVTNSAGRTDKTPQDVTVTDSPPPKPVARLTVGRDGAQFKVYVGADGSASTAGQGATITSYDFDFGDGYKTGPQSEAKANHTYERPSPGEPAKTYSLKLTVTNSAGQTADVSQGVTVTPSSGPGTPSSGPGTGGTDPGGTGPGTGGTDPGGTDPGTGGTDPVTGGTDPGTGDKQPGTGDNGPPNCPLHTHPSGNECIQDVK